MLVNLRYLLANSFLSQTQSEHIVQMHAYVALIDSGGQDWDIKADSTYHKFHSIILLLHCFTQYHSTSLFSVAVPLAKDEELTLDRAKECTDVLEANSSLSCYLVSGSSVIL